MRIILENYGPMDNLISDIFGNVFYNFNMVVQYNITCLNSNCNKNKKFNQTFLRI